MHDYLVGPLSQVIGSLLSPAIFAFQLFKFLQKRVNKADLFGDLQYWIASRDSHQSTKFRRVLDHDL